MANITEEGIERMKAEHARTIRQMCADNVNEHAVAFQAAAYSRQEREATQRLEAAKEATPIRTMRAEHDHILSRMVSSNVNGHAIAMQAASFAIQQREATQRLEATRATPPKRGVPVPGAMPVQIAEGVAMADGLQATAATGVAVPTIPEANVPVSAPRHVAVPARATAVAKPLAQAGAYGRQEEKVRRKLEARSCCGVLFSAERSQGNYSDC